MRMPRPPPPNAALTSTGKPIRAASASRSTSGPTVTPGSTGTPAASISALARIFEPIDAIASGVGPTNVSPAAAQSRANCAFSDRNP